MSHSPATQPVVIGVGIDTHRYTHQVTFLNGDRQHAAPDLSVAESADGYAELRQTLEKLAAQHPGTQLHIRLDAAGQYAANLERHLRGLTLPVTLSIGEPARNKRYRQAILPKRGKTDVTESYACGRFALVERPPATLDVPEEFRVLREIGGRLESRVRQTTRSVNALHNLLSRVFPELAILVKNIATEYVLTLLEKYPTPERIAQASLESLTAIAYLSKAKAVKIQAAAKRSVGSLRGAAAEELVRAQVEEVRHSQQAEKSLKKLLLASYRALPDSPHVQVQTIIGIGPLTAAVLVAKIVSIDRFETEGRLVSYFGTFPEPSQSGTDKYGNPVPPGTMEMSRQGSDLVRRYLWMAAKTAARHNPAVRSLYARLRARGKRGDVAYGHCMRKLLHLVFAVWKTNRPFDPNHYPWEAAPEQAKATPDEAAQQETAGHKRDVPAKEVITAAVSKVDAAEAPVKQSKSSSSKAQKVSKRSDKGPWVDFAWLRRQVTMEQVLSYVGCLGEMSKRGSQRRGRCPVHSKPGERHRSFSVDLQKNVFQCFHPDCGIHGNVLDFWAAYRQLPLREAALDLANTFHLELSENREEEPVCGACDSVPPTTGDATMG